MIKIAAMVVIIVNLLFLDTLIMGVDKFLRGMRDGYCANRLTTLSYDGTHQVFTSTYAVARYKNINLYGCDYFHSYRVKIDRELP